MVSVRREELGSASPTSSPDRELQQLFLERVGFSYTYGANSATVDKSTLDRVDGSEQEDELEFRLFAKSARASEAATARIRIRSPTRDGDQAGLLRSRPRSFYFKENSSPKAQLRLRGTVVTGEEVLARSKQPCPGLRVPWRVAVIPQSSHTVKPEQEDLVRTDKKGQKGKKARIATRKKYMQAQEQARMTKIAAEDKELAERIKKAKKNKAKKLRQRGREKQKKAAVNSEKSEDGGEDDG
jgi:hypothetical protein